MLKVTKMPEDGTRFISWSVEGNVIDFNDGDMMFNAAKKEKDYDISIDICMDYDGNLVNGTTGGRWYVAQLLIPARKYTEEEIDNPDYDPDADEGMSNPKKIVKRDPVPFSMDNCELKLWEMEV